MRTSTKAAVRALRAILPRALKGAEHALARAADDVEAALHATTAHGDVTGATRAGYTAGVVGPTLDTLSPGLSRGRAEVAARNPGHDQVSAIGATGEAVVVILTSPTDYQEKLSFDNAGAKDALGPTLERHAGALAQAAASGIRSALR